MFKIPIKVKKEAIPSVVAKLSDKMSIGLVRRRLVLRTKTSKPLSKMLIKPATKRQGQNILYETGEGWDVLLPINWTSLIKVLSQVSITKENETFFSPKIKLKTHREKSTFFMSQVNESKVENFSTF